MPAAALDAGPRQIVSALINIGGVSFELGRPAEALMYHEMALEIVEQAPELGNFLPTVLTNTGNIHRGEGRTDLAVQFFRRSLDWAESRNDSIDIAYACDAFAELRYEHGDFEDATRLLEFGIHHAILANSRRYEARCHVTLGLIAAVQSRRSDAVAHLDQATTAFGTDPEAVLDNLRKAIGDMASP